MCQPVSTPKEKPSVENLYKGLSLKQRQLSEVLLEHLVQTSRSGDNVRLAGVAQQIKELIRIVGGVPASQGEFDECCLIGMRNSNGTIDWFCTGVLIHPRIVLSAAHCIFPTGGYVVALRTNSQNSLGQAEIINVRKTVIHPQYSPSTHLNDLSVLVLQQAAQTPPVGIATSNQLHNASEVELVGFGNDDIASTKGFGIKRKVSVEIVSLRCDPNEDLNGDEAMYGYESDLEFVAGGRGFDTCNGDSGGPVYLLNGNQRTVAGLTSRATDNATKPCGDGGVYTRIDAHLPFIQSVLQNL